MGSRFIKKIDKRIEKKTFYEAVVKLMEAFN